MKPTPTLLTAALTGVFAGLVMPVLWRWLTADSMMLVIAFLVVVALPAHAFVVGFGRDRAANTGAEAVALFKRVSAWLLSAVVTTAVAQALQA